MKTTLTGVFPTHSIPSIGTKARKYLDLLFEGVVKESEAMLLFNGNQRSPIQELGGDRFGNWSIETIENDYGIITARKLDDRHLSGDPNLDAEARKQRRKTLKETSHKQAKQGRIREPRASKELAEAQAECFSGLGNAANESQYKK